ncbi:hypothetical protein MHBO_003532 [Bonamia ostreae]|uniref:Uncharacterized protein n=1 Tax=Bonamia ostreae TaxID=126728 RepID=A0ABV2AQR5_9EUKA
MLTGNDASNVSLKYGVYGTEIDIPFVPFEFGGRAEPNAYGITPTNLLNTGVYGLCMQDHIVADNAGLEVSSNTVAATARRYIRGTKSSASLGLLSYIGMGNADNIPQSPLCVPTFSRADQTKSPAAANYSMMLDRVAPDGLQYYSGFSDGLFMYPNN